VKSSSQTSYFIQNFRKES